MRQHLLFVLLIFTSAAYSYAVDHSTIHKNLPAKALAKRWSLFTLYEDVKKKIEKHKQEVRMERMNQWHLLIEQERLRKERMQRPLASITSTTTTTTIKYNQGFLHSVKMATGLSNFWANYFVCLIISINLAFFVYFMYDSRER